MFKVVVGQRVVSEQRQFVGWQIEQGRALSLGENMSPWHTGVVPIEVKSVLDNTQPVQIKAFRAPKSTRVQLGQRAAIYCRVSTADQSCERQERDLTAFAGRAGYDVAGIFKETGSGAKLDRAERRKIMALAQARQIDAVLVTELSRWGRSTIDLLNTLRELENWKVSVIAMNGMTFDLSSPHGRMLATFLSGIAEFERDLISERVKSGLAAARARGKQLGRRMGQRPKSDRLAPRVLALIAEGRSYRWIARDLGISKNTVADVAQRFRATEPSRRPTEYPDGER
ncbi:MULTISPECIES: recombinase family protein [Sinorhizobium/Ensifer group]|nr:recombinase family protein [Sinorhizobium fredii]MCK3780931.1 recombinase family protein [Ensifer sesbaniae]